MSNTVHIEGFLATDPELRYTPSGNPVVNLLIFDHHTKWNPETRRTEKVINRDGTEDQAKFSISAWGEFAENITNSLRKGDAVVVEGSVHDRSYKREDGTVVSTSDIRATLVALNLRFMKVTGSEKSYTPRGEQWGASAPRQQQAARPPQQQAPQQQAPQSTLADDEPPF